MSYPHPSPLGTFDSDSPVVVVHEQSVYTVEPGKIQVRTFQVSAQRPLPQTAMLCSHATAAVVGMLLRGA